MGCRQSVSAEVFAPRGDSPQNVSDRQIEDVSQVPSYSWNNPEKSLAEPADHRSLMYSAQDSGENVVLERYFPEDPIPVEMRNEIDGYVDYEEVSLPKVRSYQGAWEDGKQNGVGRMVYDDLGTYEGFWKNGYAHSFGIYVAGKGCQMFGSSYKGTFKDGKADGYGVFKFSDDSYYYGLFRADKRHGVGMECHKDDLQYIGPYSMGRKNGIGRLKSPNGEIYIGEFKDNEISGYGVYRWPDGRIYEGNWNMCVQEGQASFKWPDGRVYVGNYSNGKINGRGVLTWPDGRRYDGEWKNGFQDGTGDYYKDRKHYRRAAFIEGVRTRWLTDFITLDHEKVIQPIVPDEFRTLNSHSINSINLFLWNYLQIHYHIDEMAEAVYSGQIVSVDTLTRGASLDGITDSMSRVD
eukprot:GHVH01001143.1.p2 GENE.GHVH01001143.1~~GHVH01001143.1.p2  ORF type:complete len:407 (+),score=43.90 GHVH01001143.1:71-1291(+)